MCGKGKGGQQSNSQNQNVQYTPYGQQNLQNIYNAAANAASQPYRPFAGQLTADWNNFQQRGLEGVRDAAVSAGHYNDRAAMMMQQAARSGNQYTRQGINMIDRAADPISGRDIRRYENPYTNQVLNATLANIRNENTMQQQQLMGNATLRGALGGDRSAVMQAELARNQDLSRDQTIANLRSQGYSQALSAAMAQQQAQMAAGYQIGALGQSQSAQGANIAQGYANLPQSAIAANQALMGAGTQRQQDQQNAVTAEYQQYQQMMAYPYQQAQFLASIGIPAATAMGGFQTQIGETNQVYRPPGWQIATGGAVPFEDEYASGGVIDADYEVIDDGYAAGGVATGATRIGAPAQLGQGQGRGVGVRDIEQIRQQRLAEQARIRQQRILERQQQLQQQRTTKREDILKQREEERKRQTELELAELRRKPYKPPTPLTNQQLLNHYFGVGNPNERAQANGLPKTGAPIYLPGQTIQPMSQLVGPNGMFYSGQNPNTTPNQGYLFNAVPISGYSTPAEVRRWMIENKGRLAYEPQPRPADGGSDPNKPPSPGMIWDPKTKRWVWPPPPTGEYDVGGGVSMPWDSQPFSLTGGSSIPGMGSGMPPIQVADSKPQPMSMNTPSIPQQPQRSAIQTIGDLGKLYQLGKKGSDWIGKQLTPPPTDISAPGVGQTSGATLSQGTPGGTAGFGGYGELGAPALPTAAPNPATAVGEQFLGTQSMSAPGLAAGTADAAASGAAGLTAEGLGGLGIGAATEAGAAALAETGAAAATGAAGLEAIGATSAAVGAEAGGSALLALLAMLGTGGRVYADGGEVGVDENHPLTVPETLETLRAQQSQLIRGNRKVQMFPPGTEELPLPSGMDRVETPFGVFHYNPRKISREQIVNLAQAGRENELLDLGPFNKKDIMARAQAGESPVAVVERDHRGREVKAAAGTDKTAPTQMEVFNQTRTPGNTVSIEDVRDVLSGRQAMSQEGFAYGGEVDYNENPWMKAFGYVTKPNTPYKDKPGFALGGDIEFDDLPSGNMSIPDYATEDMEPVDPGDRWRYIGRDMEGLRGGQPRQQYDADPSETAEAINRSHGPLGNTDAMLPKAVEPPKEAQSTTWPPHVALREHVIEPGKRAFSELLSEAASKPSGENSLGHDWPTPEGGSGIPLPKERPANAVIEENWPRPEEQFKPYKPTASTEMTAKTGKIPLPRPRPYGEDDDPATTNQRAASAAGYAGDSPEMSRAVGRDNAGSEPIGGAISRGMSRIFGMPKGGDPVIRQKVAATAEKYGIPPVLAMRLVNQESGFKQNVVSSAGAAGVTQLMPGTARDLGVDRNNVDQNIDGGMRYLRQMYDKYGNWNDAVAAYNAGPGKWDKVLAGKASVPNETRGYVNNIMGGFDPSTASPAQIMNRDNFPGSPRKTVGQMASDPDFWLRTLINVGASDFTHGTGPMVFQGLAKTVGSYDQFSKDDLTAQQKGQELAERLYKDSQTKFTPINYTDESGRLAAGAFDPKTGITKDGAGKPVVPGTFAGKPGSSGKSSVFEQKRQAYLTIHPGDEKGALEFASGNKRMNPQEIRVKSIAAAQKMIANMPVPPKDPVAETNRLASEIEKRLIGGFEESKGAATEAAAGGKDGSSADKALPDPGEGKREKGKWYISPDGKPRPWQGE